jgi:hypothetical protein
MYAAHDIPISHRQHVFKLAQNSLPGHPKNAVSTMGLSARQPRPYNTGSDTVGRNKERQTYYVPQASIHAMRRFSAKEHLWVLALLADLRVF